MLRRPPRSTLFPYTDALPISMSKLFGGGQKAASKQFRHGATSKSRSNTPSNSTKHKSPHLSEEIYGWCYCCRYCFCSCWRPEERFSRNAETDLLCRPPREEKRHIGMTLCTPWFP